MPAGVGGAANKERRGWVAFVITCQKLAGKEHTCLGTAARGATNGRRMPEYPVMKSWTSLPSQAFDLEYRAPFSEVMFHFSHLHFSALGESCFMQFSNGPQVNQSVMTTITIVFKTVAA